ATLLEELAQDESSRGRGERIRAAAERCAKIVRSFLAMARQRPPQRAAVKIAAMVDDAFDLVGYGLRTAGVSIERDLPTELPSIWGDPDQIIQVVMNLAVNAQQALQPSPEPRRMRIAAS